MLSVFPSIMFLSLLAHALLRVMTGLVLFSHGVAHFRKGNGLSSKAVYVAATIEAICGIFLIAGFLTQVVALATFAFALIMLIFRKRVALMATPASFYLLLIGISLSLVITGAGAFAVDIPF